MTLMKSIFDHNKSNYEIFLRVNLFLYAENSTVIKNICLSQSLYVWYESQHRPYHRASQVIAITEELAQAWHLERLLKKKKKKSQLYS